MGREKERNPGHIGVTLERTQFTAQGSRGWPQDSAAPAQPTLPGHTVPPAQTMQWQRCFARVPLHELLLLATQALQ